jgi:hypothetical protein
MVLFAANAGGTTRLKPSGQGFESRPTNAMLAMHWKGVFHLTLSLRFF